MVVRYNKDWTEWNPPKLMIIEVDEYNKMKENNKMEHILEKKIVKLEEEIEWLKVGINCLRKIIMDMIGNGKQQNNNETKEDNHQ